jgi:hypothetical protein
MLPNAGVPTGTLYSQTRARSDAIHGLSSQRAASGLNDVKDLQKWSRVNNATRDIYGPHQAA